MFQFVYNVLIMQEKRYETEGQSASQTDEMLKEIRNMLADTAKHPQHEFASRLNSEGDVERYLSESFLLAQSTDGSLNKQKDIELQHSKISEASILLANETPMIKSYVKQKIESNFFSKKVND